MGLAHRWSLTSAFTPRQGLVRMRLLPWGGVASGMSSLGYMFWHKNNEKTFLEVSINSYVVQTCCSACPYHKNFAFFETVQVDGFVRPCVCVCVCVCLCLCLCARVCVHKNVQMQRDTHIYTITSCFIHKVANIYHYFSCTTSCIY